MSARRFRPAQINIADLLLTYIALLCIFVLCILLEEVFNALV